MVIIDKRKDYYDYLQGVNGQDPKAIYDRRNGICLTRENMPEVFIREISRSINGYIGIIHLFCGNVVYAFYFENYGNGVQTEFILSKRIKRTTLIPMRIAISADICKEVSDRRREKKFFSRSERKKRLIMTEKKRSEWKRYKDEDRIADVFYDRPVTWYDNPILSSFPLPIITAEAIFLNLQEFILSMNDVPVVDKRTDLQKLEAAGFDKNTSFRKM